MNETPLTWLLEQLRARGMTDLIDGYHARQRAYQKMLTTRAQDEREMHLEELRARREGTHEE